MQNLLISSLFFLGIPLSVNASWINNKPLTFNQIAEKCTGIESKWVEYNEIGFPQSAKNYLRVCIDEEVKKVFNSKISKCIEKNKRNICLATFKLD